ncbi:CDF family Co(II)/Ni(II) efflux transporter DmeF [Paramagnetospirillum magneticum]|uniref:Co/Zn/Cd efflux system component n=1 Tax=Paramagnetospirillum magneticum (strain ATCC 700264 / AMB-1) TaxID=342108 RepID=Q2W7Y7_PARM1|nr:CDF family Co(II)/Ni(II) efflux transporter DmeF [Paramagnetospirillum magneticum]BAE50038.1 Co/Zn/Cd efflux system component [Paramagnetospirillum magneticum AMB-1]
MTRHVHDLTPWRHGHQYFSGGEAAAERRTLIVVALTVVMMVAEITAGTLFNSMALLADGWHMSTHAGALGIAAFAYGFARRHAEDGRFTFGTGKVGVLGGFASAIVLGMVALLMVWESASRLREVQTIGFDEALWVAVIGLVVNLVSALILGGDGHTHDHSHDHGHDHHHDHNLRAAYVHVVADAVTSVLAIVALLFGKYLGWWWMDPMMGLVGAAVIAKWSWGLMAETGAVLLDHSGDGSLEQEVRAAIEGDADNRLADLHLWRVGAGHWAAIVSIVTHQPQPPDYYKRLLAPVHELSHVTVEILPCVGEAKS